MAKLNPKDVIGIFVVLIIGASLVSVVGTVIYAGLHNLSATGTVGLGPSNITGASAAIYGLLTLFFVIIVIMIAVRAIKN